MSCTFTKGAAKWLSGSYLVAKAFRHQFECIWCKDKSLHNQARLCKQIAHCIPFGNRDKSNNHRNLVSKNAPESEKLCRSYVMNCILFLKCVANCFMSFFSDKITKIRYSFSTIDSFTLPTTSDLPEFVFFKTVNDKEI